MAAAGEKPMAVDKGWQWSVKARGYYYRARRPLGRLRRKLQERDF
jgi:hypothetical protein